MALERYEQSTTRRRLDGQLQQHGAQTGLSTPAMFLFGTPFFAIGLWVISIGAKTVSVKPGPVHAPYWVVTVAGAMFALGGVLLWSMAVRQLRANRRHQAAPDNQAAVAALADYPWNPRCSQPSRLMEAVKPLVSALFLTLFLSIFNWWAFFNQGPWLMKIMVSLFDLFLIFIWVQAVKAIGRSLKFGPSKIEFARFPYPVGEPVVLRWFTPTGIKQPDKGTFILRCVEEWWETRGTGKNQSRILIQEEIWSGTWLVAPQSDFPPGKMIELKFETQADLPSTRLSIGKIIYWELEVNLSLPGLDFIEKYPIPVYAKS